MPSGTWPKTTRSFPRERGNDDGKYPAQERKTGPARAPLNAASPQQDADLVAKELRDHDRLNGHDRMGLNKQQGNRRK
ncbi:hypothetical protein [Mesorhizobium sp. J8]|uniref:hypothetical protein n=1 Tax=Mesorhizobium sp. J8 TaxID=2777475 RepID=UPI001916159A|nr:hypothetical protein [Mesorhizobium sp. J8]